MFLAVLTGQIFPFGKISVRSHLFMAFSYRPGRFLIFQKICDQKQDFLRIPPVENKDFLKKEQRRCNAFDMFLR